MGLLRGGEAVGSKGSRTVLAAARGCLRVPRLAVREDGKRIYVDEVMLAIPLARSAVSGPAISRSVIDQAVVAGFLALPVLSGQQ